MDEGASSHVPASGGVRGQEEQQEQVNQPDPNARMIEAVMRLAEQNAQLLELQARRPHTSLAKQFIDLGAKEFSRTIDPAEAENWLKDAVRILNRMGVANDDKVDLVAFMFKGEALHWWEATERLLTMPVPGVVLAVPQRITWARFQRGLNFKIRKELTGQEVITNYAELVHRAKMIEKDVIEEEEMKERFKKQKFSGQSGGSFGSGVTRSGGQRPQNSRGQSFHSQNRGARSGGNQFNRSTSGGNTNGNRGGSQRCFRCGAVGHLIRDCPQPDKGVTCYRCGQPGHIATYCDQQITTVVSSVGSAKNTGIGPSGTGQGGGRGSAGRPATHGRVFAMSRQDAQATPEVVAGMLTIFDRNAQVLIDPGSYLGKRGGNENKSESDRLNDEEELNDDDDEDEEEEEEEEDIDLDSDCTAAVVR
ncbi:hypothetical protein Vadar_015571 [Vaccinium darrowii]|nr:hypothetical protein Vadar_015571 [Vaccinium darrowii]